MYLNICYTVIFSFLWATANAGILYLIGGTVSGANSKASSSNDSSLNEVIYGKQYDDDGFIYELGVDISDTPQSDINDLIEGLVDNADNAKFSNNDVRGVFEEQMKNALDDAEQTNHVPPDVKARNPSAWSDWHNLQRDEKHKGKNIRMVIKYGTKKGLEAITDTASGSIFAVTETHLSELLNGDKDGFESFGYSEVLPIGKKWDSAVGLAFVESCATKGNGFNTKASKINLEKAFLWADTALDSHPDRDSWAVGFSNSEEWNLCLRIVRKESYNTKAEAQKAAQRIGCPKGYCDNGILEHISHDEL